MNVILQKDVVKVGREGEVVTVSDGYARNYLMPRGLAVSASGGALKVLEARHAADERKSEALLAQATKDQATLEGKTIKIIGKAGAGDRLYGSITSGDIAESLKKEFGVAVDKRRVLLLDPIRAIGTFHVDVKLHKDITVPVTVAVDKA
ncbi:MAG: 50S ribosomal protein L9 [Armatimonadetes bacterium]|jgi:large subunit ribosomal protein L9|nr:50S ribosomal protein L9 [Armatimonadota bacterium]